MVFAATSFEDLFRKPRTGMWDEYVKEVGITDKNSIPFGIRIIF
jgi:histidinol phosphatase-like enzyme